MPRPHSAVPCLLAALLALAWIPQRVGAADAKPKPSTFTDAKDAGPDFAVQGEYVATIPINESATNVGIHVIARGEGKFHAVFYIGGLPGAGWDKTTKYESDGETIDGVTVFKHELGSAKIVDGVLKLMALGEVPVGEARKTERSSPTLGQKPPEGAVVLFDGKSAEQFDGGRVSDDGLLMEGANSKQKVGDCTLHLEFRLPFMPSASGQARGNSGCYLQGRYEVQILDSFGLAGKNNECGGIYEISDPAVNMCLPPLAWQTYDIDFTAARYDSAGQKVKNASITVRHNGEVVQRNVELPRTTRAAPVKEGPEPGILHLQNHGNPVRFRNIWLRPLGEYDKP